MSAIKITNENYETEVASAQVPVLLDFWAEWCGPCRMMSPVVEELAEESDGKYKVGKVNVDEEPELAGRFSVSVIPTVFVVKNGEITGKSVGVKPKNELLGLIG